MSEALYILYYDLSTAQNLRRRIGLVRNIDWTHQTVRNEKKLQKSFYNTLRFRTPFLKSHETSLKFSFCVTWHEYQYRELVQILHRLPNR